MTDREHPHPPEFDEAEDVYIGLGWGERATIPVMIIGVLSIPLLSIPYLDKPYDVVRVFVLVQAFIVMGVQIATIVGSIARSITGARKGQPMIVRTLRWAYTSRIAASTILVGVMTYGVTTRLGGDLVDWRTPTLQFSLLLLALAWGFMDRRILWLERRADTPEFLRLIQELGAIRALREDREEDERQRAENKS